MVSRVNRVNTGIYSSPTGRVISLAGPSSMCLQSFCAEGRSMALIHLEKHSAIVHSLPFPGCSPQHGAWLLHQHAC